MTLLIVGLVIFLGIHSIAIVAPDWRDRIVARLGEAHGKASTRSLQSRVSCF